MLNVSNKPLKRYDYNGACLFYLFAIVVLLVGQAIGGGVAAGLSVALGDENIAQSGDFNGAFMIAVQLLSCAFIFLYSYFMRKKFNFAFVKPLHGDGNVSGLNALHFILPVVCAPVLLIGMYLITVWYGQLIHVMGVPDDFGALHLDTVSSVVMTVIATVFLAPVFEEITYRGVLLHGLADGKKQITAVMLSALAFTVMHMNPLQVPYQFALGVLSAFIALKTKRLLPSIILHSTSNISALIIDRTALGGVLEGCVAWLIDNPAAAVFITLGLFAAAGGLLFVAVKFGFTLPDAVKSKGVRSADGNAKSDVATAPAPTYDETSEQAQVRAIVAKQQKGNATIMYWIATGLCIVMIIMNLVTAIIG